jgi:hypothetical protein
MAEITFLVKRNILFYGICNYIVIIRSNLPVGQRASNAWSPAGELPETTLAIIVLDRPTQFSRYLTTSARR